MARLLLGVVALGLVGCGGLIKPPEPDRRLNILTAGTAFDSDRGYRFVVLPEPTANVIRVDVRYPVGAIDDPVGKEGLAHLIEHLLTEVEVTRDGVKTSLDGELASVSLSFNAQTTAEYTSYEAVALPGALEAVMRIEGERLTLGCAGIPRALFERERQVVQNELRQRGGDGGTELLRQLQEAAYPVGHPYRRVDTVETVAAITYEDVCAFIVGPYRRGTAIVAISGAVTEGAVQQAVAKHFGRVPKRTPAPLAPVALAPRQSGTLKLTGSVDEPTLYAMWSLPAMSTNDYRMLQIAMPSIAGNLETYGFMYGWGHSADWGILGGPRAPVLAVSIELDSATSFNEAKDRVWGAVRDTYYQVAAPGDDRDSAKWVRTWEAQVEYLLARWESLAGRNKMYSDFQQYEPSGSLPALVQALRAATPGSARAVAEKWINQSNARYLLVEPSGESAVGGGGAFSGIVEQHGAPVDRTLADKPLPKPPKQLRVAAERYVQDNGLAVVLWPNGATPLVNGRLVVDAGASDDPFGREGVANLVGASDVYPDSMVFERRDLSIRIDELLVGISGELRSPGYGLSDEGRKYMVARLEQERAKERAAYTADKLVALYGEGHPYARNEISAEGVKRLSQDSVEAWARAQIVPKNATLIVTGTFDPALIKKHIAYSYAHVAAGTRTRDVDTVPRTTPLFIVGETSKSSPTVEIDVHFVGGRGIDRDHAKRLVLEAVLDAQLSELREKRALTYGFYASFEPRRAGGLWTISGEADSSRAAEAGGAIIEILDGMRRDPESYRGAFVLARQKVLESLLVGSTSSAEVAERLVTLARFGLDDDFYDEVASDVADMTLTELHTFFVRELAATGQVFGAFGNLREARAATNAARAVKPGVPRDTIVDPFAD